VAVQLSFDILYQYSDKADGISIPTGLILGDKIVHTYANVDPGTEFCIFSNEIGLKLGLDIDTGIPKRMGSLTGTLETYGHEVTIQTFDVAFQSVIYFAKYQGLSRNLLGRIGWLRQLRLAIIDYECKLYLSQYS
jgi:hypothetical protein